MTKRKTIALIVGGGIGGLATAIALRKAGMVALVFERARQYREVGAGLSLWPNGLRALDALGVGAEVRARGVADMNSALRAWNGKVLAASSGQELQRQLGDASLVIHRADLVNILRRQLPEDAVVSGATCVGISQTADDQVVLSLGDGRRVRGDILVGADGIHSLVRAALHGEALPEYAGYTAWRAVVDFDHRKLAPGVTIGRGAQFGQAPMANGLVYWFATQNGPADRSRPLGGWRPALLEQFGQWHDPIAALIAATPEGAILHNDIIDRDPLDHWGQGRITLLGDAAHPMTPNLGQGGNQALEDAATLGRVVRVQPDLTQALRVYEHARLRRANSVVQASRRVGQVMQLASPAACWLRDAFLGTRFAARMQMKQLRALVGADGLALPPLPSLPPRPSSSRSSSVLRQLT